MLHYALLWASLTGLVLNGCSLGLFIPSGTERAGITSGGVSQVKERHHQALISLVEPRQGKVNTTFAAACQLTQRDHQKVITLDASDADDLRNLPVEYDPAEPTDDFLHRVLEGSQTAIHYRFEREKGLYRILPTTVPASWWEGEDSYRRRLCGPCR